MGDNVGGEMRSNERVEQVIKHDMFNGCTLLDIGGLTVAAAKGYIESLVNPFTYKKMYDQLDTDLSRNTISTYNFVELATEAFAYTVGIVSHIERIARNPDQMENWIPAATNIAVPLMIKTARASRPYLDNAWKKITTVSKIY